MVARGIYDDAGGLMCGARVASQGRRGRPNLEPMVVLLICCGARRDRTGALVSRRAGRKGLHTGWGGRERAPSGFTSPGLV